MAGIWAKGRCKVCGLKFNQKNDYECAEHGNEAKRFVIAIYYKGQR